MEDLANLIEAELTRQAHPRDVRPNDEPWSWRIGNSGNAWLDGSEREPSLVAQRPGGMPFPEPFDPDDEADVERVAEDVLTTLN